MLEHNSEETFDRAPFYQAVFEHSRDAIGLSINGVHIFVNPAYLRMFGYQSNEELYLRPILDLIAPSHHQQIINHVKKRAAGEEIPFFYETKGMKKNGTPFDMEVTVSHYPYQNQNYTMVILRDISDKKFSETQLKNSEVRFRTLSESSPIGIFYQDTEGNCLYANQKWQEITGIHFTVGAGQQWLNLIHPDDLDAAWESWSQQIANGGIYQGEIRFVLQQNIHWIAIQAAAIYDSSQHILGYVGTIEDISNRKNSENQIRAALAEREVLLREIHHRVKNNFQAIMSLLNLQIRKLQDPHALSVLQATRARILSMSFVHQLLYENQSLAEINLKDYFSQLTRELYILYIEDASVQLEFDLENVFAPLEQVLPCGLLLNEIVSNTFKHAFGSQAFHPLISVRLKQVSQTILIEVQDNGKGFDTNLVHQEQTTLGLHLIVSFIRQLGGHYELKSGPSGTHWQIRFSQTTD